MVEKFSGIRKRRLSPDLVFPAILFLGWLVFFADGLFTAKNFYFRDILHFHYPLHKVLIDSYARGELPLWNPFIYLGQPLLANPNYMAFYPTNLFHLVFSFDYAFKLHFLVHPLLGGLGTYLLLRRLGIPCLAAAGGSMAYQFSGTVLSFLNLYNLVPATALIPWSAWSFLRSLETGGAGRLCVFGSIMALHVIAFEPILFQCNLLFLLGLAVLHVIEIQPGRAGVFAVMRSGGAGAAFGALLASVQILPTLELLQLSARGAGFSFSMIAGWSLHPMDLLNVIIPNVFGDPFTIDRSTYWGETFHRGREGYLVSVFLGASSCLFAFPSMWSRRRRLKWIMGILVAASGSLSLGEFNPVFRWMHEFIPFLRLGRYPSKYFLLTTMAFSVLVAMGIEALLARDRADRRKLLGMIVLGGLVGSGLLGLGAVFTYDPQIPERWITHFADSSLIGSKDLRALAAHLGGAVLTSGGMLIVAVLAVACTVYWKDATRTAYLLILVLAAELMPANLRIFPLISEDELRFVPEVFQYLRGGAFPENVRVAPTGVVGMAPDQSVLAPNRSLAWLSRLNRLRGDPVFGIVHGVQYSLDNSVDGLNTLESQMLYESAARAPVPERLSLLSKVNSPVLLSALPVEDPRLQLLRTFDTRSRYDLKVYWLEGTISRAYFVPRAEWVSSSGEALAKLLDHDFPFGETVVLESDRAGIPRENPVSQGRVEIVQYLNGRVTCRVDADGPGFLVLLDSYYPGWQARVDGDTVPIHRANYAFRAIAVPAGRHEVEFRYRPGYFYAGLLLTCLTAAFGLLVGIQSCYASIRDRRQMLQKGPAGP